MRFAFRHPLEISEPKKAMKCDTELYVIGWCQDRDVLAVVGGNRKVGRIRLDILVKHHGHHKH